MRRLVFLLFVLVLTGCSVTKRVHYGGYHVEWKSVKSTPKAVPIIATKTADENLVSPILSHESVARSAFDSAGFISETAVLEQAELRVENDQKTLKPHSNLPQLFSDPEHLIPPQKASSPDIPILSEFVSKMDIKNDSSALKVIGTVFIAMGAIFLISMLIFYLAFSNNNNNGNRSFLAIVIYILFALIGILMIYIFGIWGAIFVSLGLILLGLLLLGIHTIT